MRLLERLNPGVVWNRVGETVVDPIVGGVLVPKARLVQVGTPVELRARGW